MQLKPNAKRAENAIIFLWIILGLNVVSLVSDYFQYRLLNSIANGEEISSVAASANDFRQQVIGILTIIVYIVCTVMFILWFRRAYYNLSLKAGPLSYTDGWAAGAWFVPVLNLYRPYHMMKELYNTTIALIALKEPGRNNWPQTSVVGWWWAIWITGTIVDRFVSRYTLRAETLDQFMFGTGAAMVLNIVTVVAAFLAITVIRNYAKLEQSPAFTEDYTEEQPATEEETPGEQAASLS